MHESKGVNGQRWRPSRRAVRSYPGRHAAGQDGHHSVLEELQLELQAAVALTAHLDRNYRVHHNHRTPSINTTHRKGHTCEGCFKNHARRRLCQNHIEIALDNLQNSSMINESAGALHNPRYVPVAA